VSLLTDGYRLGEHAAFRGAHKHVFDNTAEILRGNGEDGEWNLNNDGDLQAPKTTSMTKEHSPSSSLKALGSSLPTGNTKTSSVNRSGPLSIYIRSTRNKH